jgi:hypothetical protein
VKGRIEVSFLEAIAFFLADQTCGEDAVRVLRCKDRLLDHVAQVASEPGNDQNVSIKVLIQKLSLGLMIIFRNISSNLNRSSFNGIYEKS